MSYDKLSVIRKRFVDEYLIDLNATAAYKRAGYKWKNENVAGVSAKKLLSSAKIQAAITERTADRTKRTEVSADAVIQQLAKIAFANVKDFVEWDEKGNVTVKPSDEVDGTVISEISTTDTENSSTFKFKRADQMKALELLGKHMKLFTEKTEVQTTGEVKVMFNIPRPKYDKPKNK